MKKRKTHWRRDDGAQKCKNADSFVSLGLIPAPLYPRTIEHVTSHWSCNAKAETAPSCLIFNVIQRYAMFCDKCSDHFVSRMSLTHTLWFLPLEWARVSIFHDTNALRGWRDESADIKFTFKYKHTELHSHTAGKKTWREECSRRYSYHFFFCE